MYLLAPRPALFVTTPRRPQKATRKVLSGRSLFLHRAKPPPRVSPKPCRKVSRILSYLGYLSPSSEVFNVALNSFVGGCACLCFALAFVPLFTFESEEFQGEDSDATKDSLNSVLSQLPCINRTVERVVQTEPNFFGEMKRRTVPSSVMKRLVASIQKQVALKEASSSPATCGDGETQSTIPDVMVVMDIQGEVVENAKEIAKLEKQFWDNKTPTTKEC